jgi:hypothetical protein
MHTLYLRNSSLEDLENDLIAIGVLKRRPEGDTVREDHVTCVVIPNLQSPKAVYDYVRRTRTVPERTVTDPETGEEMLQPSYEIPYTERVCVQEGVNLGPHANVYRYPGKEKPGDILKFGSEVLAAPETPSFTCSGG